MTADRDSAVSSHVAPKVPKRWPLVVVSIVASVMLVGAGVMSYLFVDRYNAYHRQVGVVRDRDATIRANADQIKRLNAALAAATASEAQLQQQVSASSGQVAQLQQEKAVLGTCINSIDAFFAAVGEGSSTILQNAAQAKMETDCAAAQKYLS
ncbi:MAG TPA: hypothetical protein VKB59_00060 [Micromonosporaceae bacterium]|nr:hypothetical protein [Micromonosporaceae bacterium]